MKKTLLILVAAVAVTTTALAQRTWVVGNDPTNFPISAGIGAGPDRSVFIQDLGIHTGSVTNVNMGQVEASAKTFDGISYVNRFKYNGGGYPSSADTQTEPTQNNPTQRYLTVKVSGPGTIKIVGVTGSNSSTRRLFVTDGTTLLGTMVFPGDGTGNLTEQVVQYNGGAGVLYLFPNAAVNLYRIEVTSATTHVLADIPTSVPAVLADKGVFFNGTEVLNPNKLTLEVYNVLGKKVAVSNTNISVSKLEKGVYFVRTPDAKGAMKFSK
jgi:hypothetical protein